MKRYLLFAYDNYYPWGGWDDLIGGFDEADEATREGVRLTTDIRLSKRLNRYCVVDKETGQVVDKNYTDIR